MSLKKTVLTIVAVLTIAATANAIWIPIPSDSMSQTIDFKNFDMMGHASNWQSGNASFNGKVFLQDGFYNSSFLYADMRQEYFGDPENDRMLYTVMILEHGWK